MNCDITEIIENADEHLLDVISNYVTLKQTVPGGTVWEGRCPMCNGEDCFTFVGHKNSYGCRRCNWSGTSAVQFVRETQNAEWPEVMRQLGNIFSVQLDDLQTGERKEVSGSYCKRMLEDIGLTEKDTTARVYVKAEDDKKSADPYDEISDETHEVHTFRPGTVDSYGNLRRDGDDVIILYYDLDGKPVMFEREDSKKRKMELRQYYRVRWQWPMNHQDKEGKPFKYCSPKGSGTPIYIPQYIRTLYQRRAEIPRLYIQEGEKKAEKACKHGIPSVAISGIMNLTDKKALSEDLIRIIRDCQVRDVIFMMDSDWQDLSHSKKINEEIEKRPRNFFYAARQFKEHMLGLKTMGIYVEPILGHVVSHGGDKGIDDLLANTLKGEEDRMLIDLESTLDRQRNMRGTYCELFKIGTWTDHRLSELWGLGDIHTFCSIHRAELKLLPEFRYRNHLWKMDENGEPVTAEPFDEASKFWKEKKTMAADGRAIVECEYEYVQGHQWLHNRGFGRYRDITDEEKKDNFDLVKVEAPFVERVTAEQVRDEMMTFAEVSCPPTVYKMLLKGWKNYIDKDRLSTLHFVQPNFWQPERSCQYFYFSDGVWKITKDDVEELSYSGITHNIWREQKKKAKADYLGKLISFTVDGERKTRYTMSQNGKNCHFLQFLINCSNFTWDVDPKIVTPEEADDNNRHLLSKLCAIGYLAMDIKDPSVAKAVVAMDGQQSDIGTSNGRTGKSLVGELLKRVEATLYIPGKRKDLFDDPFIWHELNESKKVVFIDDVLQTFNFESLFPCITGDWAVNYKHGGRITLKFAKSPKIYITTNHAMRGEGSSFTDRQWLLAFSNYYNDHHKPTDDFHEMFFEDWDFEQWNLTWNLIANCIQLYLEFGVVEAPGDLLSLRNLKDAIGEKFMIWADEYFYEEDKISGKNKLNVPVKRSDLYAIFLAKYPMDAKNAISTTLFKKKLIKWCEYKGLCLNPQMYDPETGVPLRRDRHNRPITDDKTNGIEWITIGAKPGQRAEEDIPF